MSPSEYIIGKFGGLTALARAIDKPVTTVQGWRDRGKIPTEHWSVIISEGAKRDHQLGFEDFLKEHAEAQS